MNDQPAIPRRDFVRNTLIGGGIAALGASAAWLVGRITARPPARTSRAPLGDAFVYDIERFRHVDPALVHYHQVAAIDSHLAEVCCLAIAPDDAICVGGPGGVRLLERDGSLRKDIEMPEPVCALRVRHDTLYVALPAQVIACTLTGQVTRRYPAIDNALITAIDATDDRLFIADAGNRTIWRYDASGDLLGRLGDRDDARSIPGFIVPSPFFDLAIGADGLLRVVNPGRHRIELYTLDGDLELSWGNTGMAIENFCGCCNPVHIALLPDGRTVTAEKGLPRVKIYSARGRFESVVAPPALFTENASACNVDGSYNCTKGGLDVAVDSTGRIHVLDIVTRRIRVFAPKEA